MLKLLLSDQHCVHAELYDGRQHKKIFPSLARNWVDDMVAIAPFLLEA